MARKHTQNGFIAIEFVLFGIIVLLIITLGTILYQKHQKKVALSNLKTNPTTSTSTSSTQKNTQPKSKTSPPLTTLPVTVPPAKTFPPQTPPKSTQALHTTDEALSQVNAAGFVALGYYKTNGYNQQGELDVVKTYLSPELYTTLSNEAANSTPDHDLLTCSKNVPDTFESSLASTQGTNASILVKEHIDVSVVEAHLTVDLVSLKITQITC